MLQAIKPKVTNLYLTCHIQFDYNAFSNFSTADQGIDRIGSVLEWKECHCTNPVNPLIRCTYETLYVNQSVILDKAILSFMLK